MKYKYTRTVPKFTCEIEADSVQEAEQLGDTEYEAARWLRYQAETNVEVIPDLAYLLSLPDHQILEEIKYHRDKCGSDFTFFRNLREELGIPEHINYTLHDAKVDILKIKLDK